MVAELSEGSSINSALTAWLKLAALPRILEVPFRPAAVPLIQVVLT